MKKNIDHNQIM